jgi:hypothetical protein
MARILQGHRTHKDEAMIRVLRLALLGAAVTSTLAARPALAATITIDTNPTWDGNTNQGWLGSGQSFTVPLVANVFQDVGFYFDAQSHGLTFDFYLTTAMNGGSVLYSTPFVVTPGINVLTMNLALTAGSQVWAVMDYRGFAGRTAHFSGINGYAGGNSVFGPFGGYVNFAGLDHRLIANFTDAVAVPEPATFLLIGAGLAAVARRRSAIRR